VPERDSVADAGFTWSDYLDDLVARQGTLTAVAEKLAAARGFADDVASVERALRRLRGRGLRAGGKWGTRAVAVFGLPATVESRVRWLGAYHSRFTDLAVPVCEDLVRLWDRPPTTERRESRAWIALSRASIALRHHDFDGASRELAQAALGAGAGESAPPALAIEIALVEAFVASKKDPPRVPSLLARVGPLLDGVTDEHDRACLHARWIDQRAYALNRAGDYAAAEALYRTIPTDAAPPFSLCRRANGLAYARWKQGSTDEAIALSHEAARHAGDGGHVRLRAMALGMLARIASGEEAAQARARAIAIGRRLDDDLLLTRARS
jgi:hypothetical protein